MGATGSQLHPQSAVRSPPPGPQPAVRSRRVT